MSGRGDKNKNRNAGRGASNQSNQGFVPDGQNEPKSNHHRKHSGGTPSQPQRKSQDQSSNRDHSV